MRLKIKGSPSGSERLRRSKVCRDVTAPQGETFTRFASHNSYQVIFNDFAWLHEPRDHPAFWHPRHHPEVDAQPRLPQLLLYSSTQGPCWNRAVFLNATQAQEGQAEPFLLTRSKWEWSEGEDVARQREIGKSLTLQGYDLGAQHLRDWLIS